MNIWGIFGALVLNLLEGWQNAGLDHCTLSQHSSVQHNYYYAALILELQPIQINLNGIGILIKNHASKISKWSSGCRAIFRLFLHVTEFLITSLVIPLPKHCSTCIALVAQVV